MAYGFYEDKSKAQIYDKGESDTALAIQDTRQTNALNVQKARIDQLVADGTGGIEVREQLYSNASGAGSGTITLSKAASNYDCLELLVGVYESSTFIPIELVRTPVAGGTVNFSYNTPRVSENSTFVDSLAFTVSGTTLTISATDYGHMQFDESDSDMTWASDGNHPRIGAVYGVKYAQDCSTEVADIRVGYDGTAYSTAGDAIRHPIKELYEHVHINIANDIIDPFSNIKWSNCYYNTNPNDNYRCWMTNDNRYYGMSDWCYAEDDMSFNCKLDGIQVCVGKFKKENGNYYVLSHDWWGSSFDNKYIMFPIPKGCYYWIGFRYTDQRVITSNEAIRDIIHEKCELKKTSISSMTTGSDGNIKAHSARVTPTISRTYAETDIRVIRKNSNTQFTLLLYESGDIGTPIWHGTYSKDYNFVIPKGKWYRLSIGYIPDRDYGDNEDDIKYLINSYEFIPQIGIEFNDMYVSSVESEIALLRRRIEVLENKSIPDYYVSHINEKANIIKSIRPENGGQFLFITDLHMNRYNQTGNSKQLINYLCKNTLIDFVVNGGDLLGVPSDYTINNKRTLINVVQDAINYSRPDYDIPHFFVFGNHDNGIDYYVNNGTTTTIGPFLDPFDVISIGGNNANGKLIVPDIDKFAQYYYDDDNAKIRYIFAGNEIQPYTGQGYTSTYIFVYTALLGCPVGYNCVVITHNMYNNNTPTTLITPLLDAYQNKTSWTTNGYACDFNNSNGEIIAIIAGHAHKDYDYRTSSDIPVILTTTDNAGAELGGLTRTPGTITEQAFDVFTFDTDNRTINVTRIGAGIDRLFTY